MIALHLGGQPARARAGQGTGRATATATAPAPARPRLTESLLPTSACFPLARPEGLDAAGPGAFDPFRPVLPGAASLNSEGKALYQKGQFADARARYEAARAADPDFLAPALNVACSFVRQERFDEATTEVERLLARSYMPWSAEVLAAADLGALKVRPEWARIARALEGSRRAWAEGLPGDVLFVGRTRKPLGYGDSPSGVFVLGPKQEVFAWSPRTLRTRQITAEEGRVLALLPGGRTPPESAMAAAMATATATATTAAYVVAEKLVRAGGVATALRGVTLVVLDLGTLTPLGRLRLGGDIGRVDLHRTPTGIGFAIVRNGGPSPAPGSTAGGPGGAASIDPESLLELERAAFVQFAQGKWQSWTPPPGPRRDRRAAAWPVTLEPGGVAPATSWQTQGRGDTIGCPRRVRDAVGPGGVRVVEIQPILTGRPPAGRPPAGASGSTPPRTVRAGGPEGAALFGLPLSF